MVEAVRHCRAVMGAIKQLQTLDEDELYVYAKVCMCSLRRLRVLCDRELLKYTRGTWGLRRRTLLSP